MATPVETVRALYAAFKRGDGEFILNALTDDVVWKEPPGGEAPFRGTYRGRFAVQGFLEQLGATVEEESFEVKELLDQGPTVVAMGSYWHRVKRTGQSYSTDWVMVWRFRGEQVAQFEIYKDSATESAALRAIPR